jgi:hypothetical protein
MMEDNNNSSLPDRPSVEELSAYVTSKYREILSKLPLDDPGMFIYFHSDLEIDRCLALHGAPVLQDVNGNPLIIGGDIAQSAQAFKNYVLNEVMSIVQPTCIYENSARMLILHQLDSGELQTIVNHLRNMVWAGSCAAAQSYCGIVVFGFGQGRGKFKVFPGQLDGFQ